MVQFSGSTSVSSVSDLIGYAPATDPTPYCDSVLDAWRRREAIKLLEKTQTQLFAQRGALDVIGGLQADLVALCKGSDNDLVTLKSSIEAAYETICEASRTGKFPGVSSHLRKLNETIGGFRKANLIVVGARTLRANISETLDLS